MSEGESTTVTVPVVVPTAKLQAYREALARAQEKERELSVSDPATLEQARTLALDADLSATRLEKRCTATVRTLFEEEARVRALFRPIVDGFKIVHAALLKKAGGYTLAEKRRLEEERQRQERALLEQQRIQREAEAAALAAATVEERTAHEATAAAAFVAKQEIVVPPAETLRPVGSVGAQGSLIVDEFHDYELEDLAQVPREYLMLDDKAVTAALKRGIRTIPGLRIFPSFDVNTRQGKGRK